MKEVNELDEILRLFPSHLKGVIQSRLHNRWQQLQEIRLRLNQQIEFNFNGEQDLLENYHFCVKDSNYVLNQLSEHSLYRLEEELQAGYITIEGGHRVGIAGEVSTHAGSVNQLHYITFYNIRIAKQMNHIASQFISKLHEADKALNTLIIGQPQTGKTTLLRDLARVMSDGTSKTSPHKVAIIDERSEIAACINGIPQHVIGSRTDVMDACPKVEGMMMMIRSMSPEVLIVDEIGKKADATAILEAMYAGVAVICTAHSASIQALKQRPSMEGLFAEKVFSRYIVLSKTQKQGFSVRIYDENEINLKQLFI